MFYDDLISFNKTSRNYVYIYIYIYNIRNICCIIIKYILLNNYVIIYVHFFFFFFFECLNVCPSVWNKPAVPATITKSSIFREICFAIIF